MAQPQVTIIIVTRNSKMFMPSCLDSILNQTYKDLQTVVIDNDSSDGTLEFVRREFPMVGVVENNKNLGFARANNHGIRLFKSPYIVLCNPDIILEPDWLEKMMAAAVSEDNAKYSIFGCKLLKLKMINAEIGEMEKTTLIDSCGLKVLKNHRVVELGSGEDSKQFIDNQEVFGFSGALAMFKREALDKIILRDKYHAQDDYFDSSFFFYKEDVDLAWRLRLLGCKSLLIPEIAAYHLRAASGSERQGNLEIARHRNQKSDLANYYSYRNHLLVLLADEFVANLFIYSPQILWLEFRKLFYSAFFETRNLYALIEVAKMLPEIRAKRKNIFQRVKVTAKEIREWYQ
ncbi:MAG: glycosyltransferase family 2 protein [Candidatus Buchananbacteria bacterium]|jgi:GT2 family glycosyltransferase